MGDDPQHPPGLADRWRSYSSRPPVARWASRASLVVGVAIGVALLAAVLAAIARGIIWAWSVLW
jgi:hypothetical protein